MYINIFCLKHLALERNVFGISRTIHILCILKHAIEETEMKVKYI